MSNPLACIMSLSNSLRNALIFFLFVVSALLHMHLQLLGQNISDVYMGNWELPCSRLIDLPEPAQKHFLSSSSSSSSLPPLSDRDHSSSLLQQQQQRPERTATQEENQNAMMIVSKGEEQRGRNAPNSAVLPMPNENGIIIFYYHIPKTGGTTQMAPFVRHPDWRYRMVFGPGKQKRYAKELYSWLDSNWENNTRVYYEYHAGRSSPYMDESVRHDVHTWRAMAKAQNIPFFAFTVIREPLSFAVSHFNFYYASGKTKDVRYYWRPNATEDEFLELSLPNPQCLFALRSEVAYYEDYREAGKPTRTTTQDCQAVYDAFVRDFDWIGTTETLSTETFPILEQLGQVRYCPEVRNKSRDKIRASHLRPETVATIRNITTGDRYMYESAQRDFPLTMWRNFDPTPPKAPLNPKKRCKYRSGQALPPGELPKRAGERRRFLESHPDFVPLQDMED